MQDDKDRPSEADAKPENTPAVGGAEKAADYAHIEKKEAEKSEADPKPGPDEAPDGAGSSD